MANIRKFKKGANIKLSEHFHLSEMDCKCKYPECQETLVDLDHIAKLEVKRQEWDKPINITCGYRCKRYNKEVGGATNSSHPDGNATDIQVKGQTPEETYKKCDDFNGAGIYDTFVHIDSRPLKEKAIKARWDYRVKK